MTDCSQYHVAGGAQRQCTGDDGVKRRTTSKTSGEASISHRYYTWYGVSMKAVRIDYGYRAVYRLFYHIEEDKQKEIISRPTPSSFLERNAV